MGRLLNPKIETLRPWVDGWKCFLIVFNYICTCICVVIDLVCFYSCWLVVTVWSRSGNVGWVGGFFLCYFVLLLIGICCVLDGHG